MPDDRNRPPTELPIAPERRSWNQVSPSGQWEKGGGPSAHREHGRDRDVWSAGHGTEAGQTWTDRTYAGRPQDRSFAGRGPRGWRRSDDRLLEDVSEALTRDPHVDASEIEVQVKDGEVTLSGTVTDRAQKRAAEDCVDRLEGVRDVHNRIRVVQGGSQ